GIGIDAYPRGEDHPGRRFAHDVIVMVFRWILFEEMREGGFRIPFRPTPVEGKINLAEDPGVRFPEWRMQHEFQCRRWITLCESRHGGAAHPGLGTKRILTVDPG